MTTEEMIGEEFQSLSRDSGRLNQDQNNDNQQDDGVSIPQSGFGAFEHQPQRRRLHATSGFNPSVGIRGV